MATNSPADSESFEANTPAPIPSEARAEPLNSAVVLRKHTGRTEPDGSYQFVNSEDNLPLSIQSEANQMSEKSPFNHLSPASSQSSRLDSSSAMNYNKTDKIDDDISALPEQFPKESLSVHRNKKVSIISNYTSMTDDQNSLKIANGEIDINNDPIAELAKYKHFGKKNLDKLEKARHENQEIHSELDLFYILSYQAKKIVNEYSIIYSNR